MACVSGEVTLDLKLKQNGNVQETTLEVSPDLAVASDRCDRRRSCVHTVSSSGKYGSLSKVKAQSPVATLSKHTLISGDGVSELKMSVTKMRKMRGSTSTKAFQRRKMKSNKHIKNNNPATNHVFALRKGACSKRTQLGSIPSRLVDVDTVRRGSKRSRMKRTKDKTARQKKLLKNVPMPPHHIKTWSREELKSTTLVFDGGDASNPPIPVPEGIKLTSLRVQDAGLWIVDEKDPEIGLAFDVDDSTQSSFIQVPRKAALEMNKMNSKEECTRFCTALGNAYNATRCHNNRGVQGVFSLKDVTVVWDLRCNVHQGE